MNIFTCGKDIIEYSINNKIDLARISIEMEMSKTQKSEDEIILYLNNVLDVMEKAVIRAIEGKDLNAKIIKNDGKTLLNGEINIVGNLITKAVSYAMGTMMVNASMGKIVASPTAGSCGVLPGVLISLKEEMGFSREKLIDGLLVANLIGGIVARNATISGAQGGCQAEIGTATAMSSAAATFIMGGSSKECFDSAAICYKSMLGLVCDPIAGLVESPCAKRNGVGASTALLSAQMVLNGIESIIPFDEVVEAMYRVGKALPPSLRETSLGGLATTKTGIKLSNIVFKTENGNQ
jgi:L-serine dehydratase